MGGQLGWLLHLEVDPLEHEVRGQRFEGHRAGVEDAGVLVDGLDPPRGGRGALHQRRCRAALMREGHRGATYPLTGPQALTKVEQLQTIGRALGRELKFEECTPESFAVMMGRFMEPAIISMLLDYWSDTVATPDVVRSVEALNGKPGKTLARWAEEHAADFR